MNKKIMFTYGTLAMLVLIGFYLRLAGIASNHSFWSDEAYIASIARDITYHKVGLWQGLLTPGAIYQPLHVLVMSISFMIFGISEWAARFPAVLASTINIVVIYFLTTRLSSKWAGFLAAFLYTFSQLILANSTQAKPYPMITTFLLLFFYALTFLYEKKKHHLRYDLLTLLSVIGSSLASFIGTLLWIPYVMYLTATYRKTIMMYLKKPYGMLSVLTGIGILIWFLNSHGVLDWLISFKNNLSTSNITYVRELFWRNYAFIILPAMFGAAIIWQSNRRLFWAQAAWIGVLILAWTFLRTNPLL